MLQVYDDINVPAKNLLAVEFVLVISEQLGQYDACS